VSEFTLTNDEKPTVSSNIGPTSNQFYIYLKHSYHISGSVLSSVKTLWN